MNKVNQSSLRQMISLGTLALLVILFTVTSNGFLTSANIFSILRNAGATGIIAVGVTFVIITGGIDLSTGSMVALCAMTMANLYHYTLWPIWLLMVIAVLVGAAGGLFNGLIITKLNLPPFIATLATQGIFRGLTYVTAIRVNGTIRNMGMRDYRVTSLAGNLGGLFYVSMAFFLVVIIGQIVLRRTKFGNGVYATGANKKAANLSGIKTGKVGTWVYVITGVCCGIAALFMVARMQSTNTDVGMGLEFDVIAAVVVGGCALNGGRGDMIGTLIGALFMATLDNGILKYDMNSSYQLIIKGIIIILVVIFDSVYRQLMEKRAEKSRALKQLA